MLSQATITKLSSRKGVRPDLVRRFLLSENSVEVLKVYLEYTKMNKATRIAIQDGLEMKSQKV
jgi:hypothetical protein